MRLLSSVRMKTNRVTTVVKERDEETAVDRERVVSDKIRTKEATTESRVGRNRAADVSPAEIRIAGMVDNASRKSNRSLPGKMVNRLGMRALVAVAASIIAVACSVGPFESDFRSVRDWKRSQAFEFAMPDSADISRLYSVSLAVRHENYYPYRNLWIIADYVAHGSVVRTDTVNVVLSDEFGNWTGSGLGKLYQQRLDIAHHVAPGEYEKIVLRHFMTTDTVSHLSDIGLIYTEED